MKKLYETWQQRLRGNGRLLVVALATVVFVGLLPQWVSAASTNTTSTTFTSPLPKPPHGQPGNDLRDKVDAIIDRDQLMADVLGISLEELQAARESGTRLDELITKLGLDEESVHEELHTAFTEAVQQAVSDGKLTQAEADAILNPPARPEGGDHHGHGGPSGDHGSGGPPPSATETPAASAGSEGAASSSATDTTTNSANNAAPPEHPGHRPHGSQNGSNGQGADSASASATNNNGTASASGNTAQNNTGQPSAPAGHHRRGR
jgi:hypothetical protein